MTDQNVSLKQTAIKIRESVHSDLKARIDDIVYQLEKITRDGFPTPALAVCGQGSHEVRYTKYFTYYLDPLQFHGFGAKILKAAFHKEAVNAGFPLHWFDECEVIAEYPLGETYGVQGYLDILIKGKTCAIGIEQKIFSGQSNQNETGMSQLERYSTAIENNPAFRGINMVKIYMTPNKQSVSMNPEWIALSHMEVTERLMGLFDDPELSYTAIENLRRLLMDFNMGPYRNKAEIFSDMLDEAYAVKDQSFRLPDAHLYLKKVSAYQLIFEIMKGGRKDG